MNFALTTGNETGTAAGIDVPNSHVALQSQSFVLYCGKDIHHIGRYSLLGPQRNTAQPELTWVVVSGNPLEGSDVDDTGLKGVRRLRPADIPSLVIERGFEYLIQLSGQFSILVVQPERQFVFCVRDRAGARSCYWSHWQSQFVISDSAATVSRLAGHDSTIEHAYFPEWFATGSSIQPRKTAFEKVAQLQAGERIIFDGTQHELHRQPIRLQFDSLNIDTKCWIAKFRCHLQRAVRNCLPGSGSPALMLSGGLDSGPAAAIATAQLQTDHRDLDIVSWNIHSCPNSDEWPWVERLSGNIGARLHPVCGDDYLPFSALNSDVVDVDFPTFNPFRHLVNACYREAAALGASVIINCAAGDSLYPSPRFALHDAIRRGQFIKCALLIKDRVRRGGILQLRRESAIRFLASRVLGRNSSPCPPDWLTDSAKASLSIPGFWPPESGRHAYPRYVSQLFGPRNGGAIARENRFSERFGLERRDPYTDFDLLILMANMPHCISNGIGTTKWVMREAMRGILPDQFRTKSRTGKLDQFYMAGYQTNLSSIRELLLDSRGWNEWVRNDYLENVLKQDYPQTRDALLVANCIGYTLWRQKLTGLRTSAP